jgi:hypothetical protein
MAPRSLVDAYRRYAARLTFLAALASQIFALVTFVMVGGWRPATPADWGFLMMFEICAALATSLVALWSFGLAWRGARYGAGVAALLAIASVLAARILTASIYFAALTLPYAVAASLALSWLLPEIIAGVTAYVLHRRIFGAPGWSRAAA